MSAREVIAQTLFEFSGSGQGVDDMLAEIANAQTETIIDALTAAGYRILAPSELDAETVERIASSPLPPKVIAAAWGAWHSRHGGKLGPGPAFSEAITTAIRALQEQGGAGMMLTPQEIDFLTRVRDGLRLALADRKEDRVRQRVRKAGLAEVVMNPRRWVITDAGRRALQEQGGGER